MKRLRFLMVATIAVNSAAVLAIAVMHSGTNVSPASRVGTIMSAAPMLEPRSGHSATLLLDGRVLIAGGMRRNQDFYRSAELYNPTTGKFEPADEMSLARVGHAAVLLGSGKVLIVGGWVGRGCTDSAELYDPATGKFTVIANMTARRGRPSATLLANGDVLIVGGADHEPPTGLTSAEVFHFATLTFERVGAMHYGRLAHTATLLHDGRVLIAGGYADGITPTAELYDPRTREFYQTGSLITARSKHTAGLLPDGRVLIAGGSKDNGWDGTISSAEIYDPHTGKFSATSSMNDSRFKLPDAAVQIASGQLLIAGGSRQVEIYNPDTGKFVVAAGLLSDSWHYMSETRLKNGNILLAGGYPNSDQATSQTWIYRDAN